MAKMSALMKSAQHYIHYESDNYLFLNVEKEKREGREWIGLTCNGIYGRGWIERIRIKY